jgi:hypothetical protein
MACTRFAAEVASSSKAYVSRSPGRATASGDADPIRPNRG